MGYGDCNYDNLTITSSLKEDFERNNWCHLKWKSNGDDGDDDDIGGYDDCDDDDLTRFIVIIIIRPCAQ